MLNNLSTAMERQEIVTSATLQPLFKMAQVTQLVNDLEAVFSAWRASVLEETPRPELDTARVDNLCIQLQDLTLTRSHAQHLLPTLIQVLFSNLDDSGVMTRLATKLLEPLTFEEALEIASDLYIGLALQAYYHPNIQVLAMTVIEKAATSVSMIAILSNKHDLIEKFINTWLTSPSTAVGEKGTATLGKLLAVECVNDEPHVHPNGGSATNTNNLSHQLDQQRLFWRRIFSDRVIYRSILDHCSNKTIHNVPNGYDGDLSPEQLKTLAQHRLMNALVAIASLDFSALTRSDFPDIDKEFDLADDEHGLLYFAALHMIDHEDLLLEKTYEAFFQDLIIQLSRIDMTTEQVEFLKTLLERVFRKDANMKDELRLLHLTDDTEEVNSLLRTLRLLP